MISLKHKYALLENGRIEPLRYTNGEMRWVEKEGKTAYLCYDDYKEILGQIATVTHHKVPIVRTANTEEELKDDEL